MPPAGATAQPPCSDYQPGRSAPLRSMPRKVWGPLTFDPCSRTPTRRRPPLLPGARFESRPWHQAPRCPHRPPRPAQWPVTLRRRSPEFGLWLRLPPKCRPGIPPAIPARLGPPISSHFTRFGHHDLLVARAVKPARVLVSSVIWGKRSELMRPASPHSQNPTATHGV